MTSLRAFRMQLTSDWAIDRRRTTLFIVLFVVGAILWVPPLVRGMVGDRLDRGQLPSADTSAKIPAAEQPEAGEADDVPVSGGYQAIWSDLERSLRTDPLLQSVAVSSIQSDPFRIDSNQLPRVALGADEPAVALQHSSATVAQATVPSGLVLKSTFISRNRRAAFINDQLYFEGDEILHDHQTYVLKQVHPIKVLLARGSKSYELEMSPLPASGSIQVQRTTADDEQE